MNPKLWEIDADNYDDKKTDLVYVDAENGFAVILQSYLCKIEKEKAPSNKASDLNKAIAWLLNSNIEDLPEKLKSHANELRREIIAVLSLLSSVMLNPHFLQCIDSTSTP